MVKLTAQQKKNILFLVPLVALLISALVFYIVVVRIIPNDKILTTSDGVALFANENPTFNVEFGDKNNPDRQWVRFEAEASVISPFVSGKKNIFTQIAKIFSSSKKSGIEMSLRGVDFSETEEASDLAYDQEVQTVADLLGTEEIKTSTVLAEMGREIGKNDDDQIISKQTIINQGVADGIDLEYQILTGLGLKEEIVINDLEAYRNSCDNGCKLPLNEFVFDLKMDEGVGLRRGWYTIEGKSTETYYFVDSRGKYLAHFLPNYAMDGSGEKTYNVDLEVSEESGGNYEVKVTVASDWLLDENRLYPIRIDPSIVHDDTSDFSGGIFNGIESVTGPKVQITALSRFGEYISPSMDMGGSMSGATLSWTPSGVNTGSGETPYSTTGLVAQWDFNETSGTAADNTGSCGATCDGTLTNFASTGSQDAANGTGWTSVSKRWGAGALMFDGSNDYVSAGDQSQLEPSSVSVAAWVKIISPQVGVYRRVAGKYEGSTNKGYHLVINGVNGGGPYFQIGNGTSSVNASSPDYSVYDGEWHHIVGTYNGTDLKIYVDGIERGTNTSSAISYGTEAFCIGGNCSTAILNAVIDSVTVYSRALSASEVLSNYQAGNIEFQYRVSTDNSTWSDWNSYGTSASDLAWESFDEPYLYNSDTTGLTGYWPMEETSGSSVADVVGSSSGTATGTTIIDGQYGKGRNLNGTSDYISMSDSDTFNFGTNSFTMGMWVKLTNTTTAEHGLYTQYTDSNNRILFYIETTSIKFYAISGGTVLANYTGIHGIPENTWVYLTAVRDGTNFNIYVNATNISLVASVTIGSNSLPNLSSSPRWGSAYFNSAWKYLSGDIDEVELFNVAFSASDVEANYFSVSGKSDLVHLKGDSVIKSEGDGSRRITVGNANIDKNTVALWHLDERGGSGAYIKDSSGNGLHGTPTGTVYSNSGKVSGARYYDTGTTRIDIATPPPASLNFTTTAFTVEAWINLDSYSAGRYITNCDDGSAGWGFSVNTSGQLRLTTRGTTDNETVGTTVLATGQWYHVAAVFTGTGGQRRLYINGNLEASESYTGSITTSTVAFTLGNRSTTYYRGFLDEIRISNIARTAEEISESYMLGADTFVNKAIEERDLSSLTTLPIDIAGDRPGSYLDITWGEEEYFNYQPDVDTVGLWHLDTEGKGAMYMDSSKNSNNGITTYYGMRYGILSSNLTMIMNQWNGAANNYEMDITCTGGDSACQITTLEGVTISTPTINYGVAGQESAGDSFIMYSPSLSGQSITAYANNSQNYIRVRYSSGWQYDNNTSWVSFTPTVSNILVASTIWGTSVRPQERPVSSEGITNSAMEFDGSNDRIEVPDSSSLDQSSSFTVEAWIKPNSLPTVSDSGAGIVTKGGAGDASADNHNYWLSLCYGSTWAGNTGDGYSFGFENSAGSNYYATLDETLLVDSWHYLVGVFNDSSNELRLYHNGQLVKTTTGVTATPNTQAIDLTIGGMTLSDHIGYFDGVIDEVRISNTSRTSWEIREAYEMGLRTHTVDIEFGAYLTSGNLITGSGDTSFSIDATVYGLGDLGSELYVGEKVIVKENYDGTEYLAQGTVATITDSTGAVTVSSWDAGSTFPSAGYTVNADVFKWQREYIPIKERTLSYQVNATNLLTFNITDGDEGRNIWIDDLRSTSGYLSGYTGEDLTFPSSGRYFQYKAIFNTWDPAVTPYISQVQLDYVAPGPTIDQIMRHGKWFNSSGVKQPFWWVGTP